MSLTRKETALPSSPSVIRTSDASVREPRDNPPYLPSERWMMRERRSIAFRLLTDRDRALIRVGRYEKTLETIVRLEGNVANLSSIPRNDDVKYHRTLKTIQELQSILVVERERLDSFVYKVSPMNSKLPFELLAIILHLAVSHKRFPDTFSNTMDYVGNLSILRSVCSLWTHIIDTCGEFWDVQFVRLPICPLVPVDDLLQMRKEQLERCSPRPLKLVLASSESPYIQDFLPGPCDPRYLPTKLFLKLIEEMFLKAEHITFIGNGPTCYLPRLPELFNSLKSLEINGLSLPYGPTHYYVLCYTPNLESLGVFQAYGMFNIGTVERYKDRISLTKLKKFHYIGHPERRERAFDLASKTSLPGLLCMKLAYLPVLTTPYEAPSSLSTLTSLELGPGWQSSLIRMVSQTPRVDSLVVNGQLAQDHSKTSLLFIGHFLEQVGAGVLAANLKSLTLKYCAFTVLNVTTMMDRWHAAGTIVNKAVTFEHCFLTGHPRRGGGKLKYVRAKGHQYGARWTWIEHRPVFSKHNAIMVTTDTEDEGAEERDAHHVKAAAA